MPPANDNFANAIPLNPAGGNGWFNNIGATAEAHEPANQGATVWFSLAAVDARGGGGQVYFFDTREPDPSVFPQGDTPYLNTIVQVFTGSAVNALTELPTLTANSPLEDGYVLAGKQGYPTGGLCVGSYIIALAATAGNETIYIRVDGVPNGWFFLRWGLSNGVPTLGKCGNCTVTQGLKATCIGTFQGPDLTTGDIKTANFAQSEVFAVKRQTITAPAGTYMLRYCSGYYQIAFASDAQGPVYGYSTLGTFPGLPQAYWFTNNSGAGLRLSPYSGLGATVPGDVVFVYNENTLEYAFNYYDFSNTLQAGGGQYFNTYVFTTGPGPVSCVGLVNIQNFQGVFGDGLYHGLFNMARNQSCNTSPIFTHEGGQINWMCSIQGANAPAVPDQYDVPVAQYFNVNTIVGPAGPPTYELMRILPDISLFAVANIWMGATPSPNGTKNTQLNITWKNNSALVGWGPIRITETGGWFAVEDPAYYPSPPYITNIPAGGNFGYQVEWAMNANGNIGSVTLALSDSVPNPYPGPFTINLSPLFGNPVIGFTNPTHKATINGIESAPMRLVVTNIGNSTTIALTFTLTATVNGQPVQICGFNDNPTPYGSSVTFSPHTNNSDPINPSGNGLGIDPGNGVTINIAIPLTSQPQNVVLNVTVSDGSNALPPVQASVTVPAA